jgi:GNAT superfamily N-acetyltransferase
MSEFEVRPITADATRPLRAALLRGEDEERSETAGGAEALHLGGFRNGRLVGFASVAPQRAPGDPGPAAWRIRAIAVDHGHRGYGLGGLMLRRCIGHAADRGARIVWSRIPATVYGFFERHGFERSGDPYEDAGRLPHYLVVADAETRRRE